MALKATIYKATLAIADLDRQFFTEQTLTLARHPSETAERMMLRLLAWCCYADERLQFTRGLSADQEPELWRHNDHGSPELWIELGLIEEKRVKRASSLADEVVLFTYGNRAAQVWRQQTLDKLKPLPNLSVWYLGDEPLAALTQLAARNMSLQITLQEGIIWISNPQTTVELQPELWLKTN